MVVLGMRAAVQAVAEAVEMRTAVLPQRTLAVEVAVVALLVRAEMAVLVVLLCVIQILSMPRHQPLARQH